MLKKIFSNKYVIAFIAIILIIVAFKVMQSSYEKKLEVQKVEIRKLKIQNDTLTKVADGHYQKLVADTLTKKQLRKEIADLKLEIKNGVIVEKIVIVPEYIEKPIDSISIEDSTLFVTDYYPKKDDWFIKYQSKINLLDSTGDGTFLFSPLPISLVISQLEDGTFRSDLTAPDFITVESLEVLSLPLEPVKKDNFGFLAGGKVTNNFSGDVFDFEVLGGIRYKKVNVISSISTRGRVGLGTLIEF